jgi:glucuronosyltransferase
MSLGTNVKSSMLPKETLINILMAFKEISSYNFLWKFESDEFPMEKPPNVRIEKFLPQNDLLASSHVKAFITHCGIMSVQEALWYGKPLVGMPIFGDQRRVGILKQFKHSTIKAYVIKFLESSEGYLSGSS